MAQPGVPLPTQGFRPREVPDSLCGKSSALKTFRQKCAPRRATPVGLSRLLSMSSLSSEGSFLSSYNTQQTWSLKALHGTSSRPQPAPPDRCTLNEGESLAWNPRQVPPPGTQLPALAVETITREATRQGREGGPRWQRTQAQGKAVGTVGNGRQ